MRNATDAVGYCQPPTELRGHWMQTFTGRRFHFMDPSPDEIDIVDIAAAQSKICRFAGHCLRFVSVAEHSVMVLREARNRGVSTTMRRQRTALLHDGSEGYITDIARPLKMNLPEYLPIEARLMKCIAMRFDFDWPPEPWLKDVDNAVGLREAVDNMANGLAFRECAPKPAGVRLQYWSPEQAMAEFLREARTCEVQF